MQLGTRLRYGMLAMMELARRVNLGPVRAADIARSERLSRGYLEGLLAALRRAGLVRAVRGPGGGWVLARPASRVRPLDIYAALEGPTALAPCVEKAALCPTKAKNCQARRLWVAVTRSIEKALRAETLAALAGVTRRNAKKSRTAEAKSRGKAKARSTKRGKAGKAKAKARPKAKIAADRSDRRSRKRKAAVGRSREIVRIVKAARLRRSA